MSASTPSEANTVFVVDDDAGMLESTQWLLESVGLQVRAYSDGRQFLNDVGENRPGCVVLDIRMPGLGGLNVQEELQKRGLEIPIIFVSRSEEHTSELQSRPHLVCRLLLEKKKQKKKTHKH